MRREIAIVVFPGFQLLDAAGPIAVFEMAERFRPDSYAIKVLSLDGGSVRSSSGVCLTAAPLKQGHFDTVIVCGGNLARNNGLKPQYRGRRHNDGIDARLRHRAMGSASEQANLQTVRRRGDGTGASGDRPDDRTAR